jgi:hypothetical protein
VVDPHPVCEMDRFLLEGTSQVRREGLQDSLLMHLKKMGVVVLPWGAGPEAPPTFGPCWLQDPVATFRVAPYLLTRLGENVRMCSSCDNLQGVSRMC